MPSPPANLPEMIAKYSGNLSFIANTMQVPRSQLTAWLDADPSLRKCLRDARRDGRYRRERAEKCDVGRAVVGGDVCLEDRRVRTRLRR